MMTVVLLNHLSPGQGLTTLDHRPDPEVNILIADDHRVRTYRIWASLSAQRDIPVINTGASIDEVLSLATRHVSQLSMVSARFGGGQALSLAHRLKHLAPLEPLLIYADLLSELIERVLAGEKLFPPLLPDPFDELASQVAEQDRRIVAMLLAGAHPDEIADLCGVSAREIRLRRQTVIRRLDAAFCGSPRATHA